VLLLSHPRRRTCTTTPYQPLHRCQMDHAAVVRGAAAARFFIRCMLVMAHAAVQEM
jgi:hypothetical protein